MRTTFLLLPPGSEQTPMSYCKVLYYRVVRCLCDTIFLLPPLNFSSCSAVQYIIIQRRIIPGRALLVYNTAYCILYCVFVSVHCEQKAIIAGGQMKHRQRINIPVPSACDAGCRWLRLPQLLHQPPQPPAPEAPLMCACVHIIYKIYNRNIYIWGVM